MLRHSLVALAATLVPAGIAYAQTEPEEPATATAQVPSGSSIGQAVVAREVDQSTNVTVQVEEAPIPEPPAVPTVPARPPELSAFLLHGFRLGYMYTFDIESPVSPDDPRNLIQAYGMRSAHSFLFGYEVAWRMIGHDWLNVLAIANISIAGLEQSQIYPSGNLLVGFEAVAPGLGQVQFGVGASFSPTKADPAHMIFAAGVAPQIGSFYLPLHVFFIPDINGHHRIGVTLGTNFY